MMDPENPCLRRRDFSKGLLLIPLCGAAGWVEAQQKAKPAPRYAPGPGELPADVFQTDYPPGDIRRYHDPAEADDWTRALHRLRAVGANGIACFIPSGTYRYTASPNWAIRNLQLTGERGTILQFVTPPGCKSVTGPAFIMDSGGRGSRTDGVILSNLIISGDCTRTDGLWTRGIVRSTFRNIEVRNCSGKAFNIQFSVANQFDTCFFSIEVFESTILPATGFCLDDDGTPGYYTTTTTFTNCFATGFQGVGCEVANGSGNTFVGCTFEHLRIGLSIGKGSDRNRFTSTWFESNKQADVRILGGTANNFSNCNFISPSSEPNVSVIAGQATLFEGGYLQRIDLGRNSRDTLILGTVLSGSAMTGSGTYKMIGATKADRYGQVISSIPDVR